MALHHFIPILRTKFPSKNYFIKLNGFLKLNQLKVKSGLGFFRAFTGNSVLSSEPSSFLLTKLSKQNTDGIITSMEVRSRLKDIVGASKSWSSERESDVLKLKVPTDQKELQGRKMVSSYRECCIPLGSNVQLREKYINFHNGVRFGRILEDLDTMAVWISYTHNTCETLPEDPAHKSPLVIVTAAVDRIDVKGESLLPHSDIVLRGHVSWVGETSMEVTMCVDQIHENDWKTIVTAKFVMVARDPTNTVKAVVYPLSLEIPQEKLLFEKGKNSKVKRRENSKMSLLRAPPTESERLLIHDIYLNTLSENASTLRSMIKPDGTVWMEDAVLKNINICFPQERNIYNKMFGGFLMRQALELAWANACVYSGSRPYLLGIDDIIFRQPVEIGALLYLSSQVTFTNQADLQIKVHARVVNPKTGSKVTTNVFHFTFTTKQESVPPVIPKSYAEYMLYLDGKRHYEEAILLQNS